MNSVNTSVTVSHRIGEGPWRSSSQPTPFITFCVVLKKQQLEIKYKNKQTNAKHGEVKLQMNRACLCTEKSGSNSVEEIWCGQKML